MHRPSSLEAVDCGLHPMLTDPAFAAVPFQALVEPDPTLVSVYLAHA